MPNNDIGQTIRLNNAIKKFGAGGIIFSDGQAERLADMINYFQQISKVPLLIAEDCELRPGIRLEGIERLPDWITLGAIQDDSLIYQMSIDVSKQFKRIGVHCQPLSTEFNRDYRQRRAGCISMVCRIMVSFQMRSNVQCR